MLYEAIIIGVIVGALARGRLMNLAHLDLRHIWLVFLAFAIEIGMDWLWGQGSQWVMQWRLVLETCFYFLLFVFLWLHRELPGMPFLAIGFLLNFAVIAANGGAMPASVTGLDPDMAAQLKAGAWLTYTVLSETTRLPWLGDVLVQPWPKNKIFSVGDIFISLGAFWLVFRTMTNLAGSGKLTTVRAMKM